MPLIAMTREMGSLGKDVAAGIAARANKKVVYHEIIEPIANKMRLRKSHVERFLEGKSGLWERLTTDRTSLSIFTADETFRVLRAGEAAVIRGWGAAHLLGGIPHVVRLRICAPMERFPPQDAASIPVRCSTTMTSPGEAASIAAVHRWRVLDRPSAGASVTVRTRPAMRRPVE